MTSSKRGDEPETIDLPCLFCGKVWTLKADSHEATGVFNAFCSDNGGECEDRYAATL